MDQTPIPVSGTLPSSLIQPAGWIVSPFLFLPLPPSHYWALRNYTIRIADVSARHSETPAQYYENMALFVTHVPACRWFRDQQSNTRNETLPSCIRQLCYAMNGLYKDMCHGTILSCLTTLCDQPQSQENKEQIIALLMTYFGTVDLTDAINRVTGSNDHELVQKFQCLNASLMATFSDLYFADMRLLQF